jgi:hypothetical protein
MVTVYGFPYSGNCWKETTILALPGLRRCDARSNPAA